METSAISLNGFVNTVFFHPGVGTKVLGIFDKSVPKEDLCRLEISNDLEVGFFDNQSVEWSPGYANKQATILLPSGKHSFGVKYYKTRTSGHFTYTETVLTKILSSQLIPRHHYRIYKQRIWVIFSTITRIRIKDVTNEKIK